MFAFIRTIYFIMKISVYYQDLYHKEIPFYIIRISLYTVKDVSFYIIRIFLYIVMRKSLVILISIIRTSFYYKDISFYYKDMCLCRNNLSFYYKDISVYSTRVCLCYKHSFPLYWCLLLFKRYIILWRYLSITRISIIRKSLFIL